MLVKIDRLLMAKTLTAWHVLGCGTGETAMRGYRTLPATTFHVGGVRSMAECIGLCRPSRDVLLIGMHLGDDSDGSFRDT